MSYLDMSDITRIANLGIKDYYRYANSDVEGDNVNMMDKVGDMVKDITGYSYINSSDNYDYRRVMELVTLAVNNGAKVIDYEDNTIYIGGK